MADAKARLIGNIGSIDAKYSPQGKLIVNFSLAVNIGYGDNKRTNWYKCIGWEKTGELINRLAQKGTQILVEGTQELREWTDKEGLKHTSVEVTVQDFKVFARGKKAEDTPYDDVIDQSNGQNPEDESQENY